MITTKFQPRSQPECMDVLTFNWSSAERISQWNHDISVKDPLPGCHIITRHSCTLGGKNIASAGAILRPSLVLDAECVVASLLVPGLQIFQLRLESGMD